ncbi:MAG: hypothetical protein M3N49_11855 [Candidatus Eremiobacteraeota bacterium]|nr:hypothetical protein [Candidatus Eremiobacteraeota bacterium]
MIAIWIGMVATCATSIVMTGSCVIAMPAVTLSGLIVIGLMLIGSSATSPLSVRLTVSVVVMLLLMDCLSELAHNSRWTT